MYQEGDIVTYQGSTYRRNNVGNSVVGIVPTNVTYWQVVAERGIDGTTGTSLTGWTITTGNHIVPNTDNLQDLGTPANRVRHVYVGPGSVYIGSNVITESATGGLVLPGVTRATGYYAEEVENEDRWGNNPTITGTVTVIDATRYDILSGRPANPNYNPATYTVEKDGNRIDEINVSNGGSGWTKVEADYARDNNMYATNVAGAINNFNASNWTQIPFRVEIRAEDTEYEDIFGGGASALADLDDVRLDGPSEGQVLTWNDGQEKWENRDATGGNADTGDITFDGTLISTEQGNTITIQTTTGVDDDNRIILNNKNIEIYAYNDDDTTWAELLLNNTDTASPWADIWVKGTSDTEKVWRFKHNGDLTLPAGGDILDSNGDSVLGGATNLGNFKIIDGILGTQGETSNDWGSFNINIDPGGESYAYIYIPSVANQNNGESLQLHSYATETSQIQLFGRGGVQITTTDNGNNPKVFEFDNRGALRLPAGGDILDSNGDSVLGGGSGTTTVARQDTPPATGNGTLWYNTLEGRLYIKYSNAWVDAAPLVMPAPDTDIDVASITFPDATVQTSAFPNKLVNGVHEVVLGANGNLTLPGDIVFAGGGYIEDSEAFFVATDGGFQIQTNKTAGQKDWIFDEDGSLTMPGAVANSTVAKTGGGVGTETAIDLTKTVNKLTDGVYTLADGVEGQIMYLVRQTGAAFNNIVVMVANGRVSGAIYTAIAHFPFQAGDGSTQFDMDTLIFTDGAWQASNGGWD